MNSWNFAMNHPQLDPIMSEVRRVREALSARFNNDPDAIVQYLQEQRKKHESAQTDLTGREKSNYQVPPAA